MGDALPQQVLAFGHSHGGGAYALKPLPVFAQGALYEEVDAVQCRSPFFL